MKTLVAICGLGLAALFSPVDAWAYPDRPVAIVVPAPPGGSLDGWARQLADGLAKDFDQSFVVLNKPGASQIVATEYAARAKPDGLTLLVGNTSLAINPVVQASLPYDAEADLDPVSLLFTTANIVVTLPDSPYASLEDLIAAAKADPGGLSFSSYGIGAPTHLAIAFMAAKNGLDIVHLPYPGNAPALEALLGGHVDFMMLDAPSAVPLIRSGQLKALAVSSNERMAILPDVPTTAEIGEPEMSHFGFQGILVPAGTPSDIVQSLNEAIVEIAATPAFREPFVERGYEVLGTTPEEFDAVMRDATETWRRNFDAAGITLEQ